MDTLSYINYIIAILFAVCCCYHLIFLIVKLVKKPDVYETRRNHKYAVVISARNEEAVIAHLIESIQQQNYPSELIDIFVVADNCTDNTAEIARAAGAIVYERKNLIEIGKGYALSFLFDKIKIEQASESFEGYFIFDADNLLEPNYIAEMNKVFSNGFEVVTGYRNTKNYDANWITANYGLWFLRESEYLNYPRHKLGTCCALSGTGFLISNKTLLESGGWNYHLLTEDLEFTADLMVRGKTAAYCHEAILYDEQPESLRQSVTQRSRWLKGSLQVFGKYGRELVKGVLKNGSFSCYDMLMNSIPSFVITSISVILNIIMFFVLFSSAKDQLPRFFQSVLTSALTTYLTIFMMALVTLITEWKRIHCGAVRKVLYALLFPIFVLTFVPALLTALFGDVQWKPIKHSAALSIGEMGTKGNK